MHVAVEVQLIVQILTGGVRASRFLSHIKVSVTLSASCWLLYMQPVCVEQRNKETGGNMLDCT